MTNDISLRSAGEVETKKLEIKAGSCAHFLGASSADSFPPFSSPEPTILLACGRNRELWEQPFQACAIDVDYVGPDGQNSVTSFVISKWLLPELSIPAPGQKDRRLWGRECLPAEI